MAKHPLASVADLKAYEPNPRGIEDDGAAGLAISVDKFGDLSGIVYNERFGDLVCGHQRMNALRTLYGDSLKLNRKKDAIVLPNGMEFGIRVVDEDRAWHAAANIAANSRKIQGHFTDDVADLVKVAAPALSLDEYVAIGLKELEAIGAEDKKGPLEDDEPPEPPSDPVTDVGDIWTLGRHRLVCGDSTSAEVVAAATNGEMCLMAFTDPPYNVDYGASKNPRHKIRSIENDALGDDDWMKFVTGIGQRLQENVAGDCYVWGASGPDGMRMRLKMCDMGFHWSATIVWKKQQLVLSPANYQRMYEPALYGWFGKKSSFCADRKQVEVWEFDRPRKSELHPTMKPLDLCAYGIQNSSPPGGRVLDLFLGSGSTLIASEQVDRVCCGVELDPAYCDVIVERWETLTGEKATRAKG